MGRPFFGDSSQILGQFSINKNLCENRPFRQILGSSASGCEIGSRIRSKGPPRLKRGRPGRFWEGLGHSAFAKGRRKFLSPGTCQRKYRWNPSGYRKYIALWKFTVSRKRLALYAHWLQFPRRCWNGAGAGSASWPLSGRFPAKFCWKPAKIGLKLVWRSGLWLMA